MRIAVAAVLLVTATAEAHIALVFPPPRTAEQKAGPCGVAGSARGTAMSFQPGEVVTVEWDETVDHPGHYRIAFDSDGTDAFQNPNNPADNFPSTMVEPIADKTGGHYTQMITMPMTPCTDCTLQLMQIMTTAVPYNSFYYQCADVTIEGDAAPTGPAEVEGGCSTGAGAGPGMLIVGAVMWRRRRRSTP
jgi:hypothetical protein